MLTEWINSIVATLFAFDDQVVERLLGLLRYDAQSPLTLTTGFFLLSFLIFGIGYVVVRNRAHLRTWYVVLFSLYFYYKLSGVYLLLLLFVAVSDFSIGSWVARRKAKQKSTGGAVALSVVINLAILVYFKATNFFVDVVNNLYGSGTLDFESVVVPAGVSFFVFQSIAYVVDIARGEITPLRRFSDYLFMLSFFPKMFLGPLVKAKEFIPQIEAERVVVKREDMGRAVSLIAGGIVKYAIIAKSIGVLFVAPAFAGEMGDSGVVALMAIYGFTLQIYCDFSGYSDIAQGVALMMGFRLPDNFNAPYHSATITEFWRRWHISLSTWLKEYLYISLGGNRKGAFRTYFNLIITMFLGGLWHGVGLTFMAWGMLHGVALALHKVWLKVVPGAKALGRDMKPLWRVLATLFTFHLVAFGWLLFTAKDMTVVGEMLHNIAYNFSVVDIVPMVERCGVAFVIMAIGYLLHLLPRRADEALRRGVVGVGFVGQCVIMVVAIWMVVQCNAMLAAEAGAAGLPIYAAF
ncbi:MAG: MBOAT family protein [Alistipes sp.]|nr:MBOAT family protein [Alistipes sp.]